MNDFDSDFEHELHESRPAPRGELLDSLVSKIGARPAPVRKSKWQLRLAGVHGVPLRWSAWPALGGVSVASNAVSTVGQTSGNTGAADGDGQARRQAPTPEGQQAHAGAA